MPAMDINTATRIRASLYTAGRVVNQAETRLAPMRISEIRISDFAIRSRRYGSNMVKTVTVSRGVVNTKYHKIND